MTQHTCGCDTALCVSFEADWNVVEEHKQKNVIQNTEGENATQIPHMCSAGHLVFAMTSDSESYIN